jgi:hypothetical protein
MREMRAIGRTRQRINIRPARQPRGWEGRLFLLALITSIPGTPEVQAEYRAKRDENRGARPSVWSPAPRD